MRNYPKRHHPKRGWLGRDIFGRKKELLASARGWQLRLTQPGMEDCFGRSKGFIVDASTH